MSIFDAKSYLRSGLAKVGLKVRKDDDEGLSFSSDARQDVRISTRDLSELELIHPRLGDFAVQKGGYAISCANFAERSVIEKQSPGILRLERLLFTGEAQEYSVEISKPSPAFIWSNLLLGSGSVLLNNFPRTPIFRSRLEDQFRTSLTIKYYSLDNFDRSLNSGEIHELMESCIFSASVNLSAPLQLADESTVPATPSRLRRFRSLELPTPLGRYRPELIRFYNRAIGSQDPFIRFISFYHVLEFFFVEISEARLERDVLGILKSPRFSASTEFSDKIISSVRRHKVSMDETEKLKSVISEFIAEEDLIAYLRSLESKSPGLYSGKAKWLGGDAEAINAREGHTFGPIAKRIKSVRDSLVHSSDFRDRARRYVPGGQDERDLEAEVPLIAFLAEHVIAATANPWKGR